METQSRARDVEMKQMRDSLNHLQGRNAVLEELFKGRDPQMQNFLKDAPQLIQLAKANSEAIEHLTNKISEFLEAMKILKN